MEQDITQYKDKKVILVRKLDGPNEAGHLNEEIEGVVLEANPQAGMIFFRQRGKTMGTMVKMGEVEDIRLAPAVIKPVKVKPLKDMTLDTVRQHLADRHGLSVELLNTTHEEQAMKMHDELHASNKDLAHNHGQPGQSED